MSLRGFAIIAALVLAGCGSIYEEPLPAATDAQALANVASRLPPKEARLLELWRARREASGGRTIGQVLTAERQSQYLALKTRADIAEMRCVQLQSGNPRVDTSPMVVAPDPLRPDAAHPAALDPCKVMAYYKRQVAAIEQLSFPASNPPSGTASASAASRATASHPGHMAHHKM